MIIAVKQRERKKMNCLDKWEVIKLLQDIKYLDQVNTALLLIKRGALDVEAVSLDELANTRICNNIFYDDWGNKLNLGNIIDLALEDIEEMHREEEEEE